MDCKRHGAGLQKVRLLLDRGWVAVHQTCESNAMGAKLARDTGASVPRETASSSSRASLAPTQ
ncbi:hypothetical protein AK973_1294 [Pseudomonas brassicacearum]|nr:hypothetical protein AK973_1294 [Pseudomonas brassicacearum]